MTEQNPRLGKRHDEALRERMAVALHGIEDYPHPMQNHEPAPVDSLDCMAAHRSKAYSILAYMDTLLRREAAERAVHDQFQAQRDLNDPRKSSPRLRKHHKNTCVWWMGRGGCDCGHPND